MKTNNFFVFVALICLMSLLKPENVFTQDLNDSTANYFTLTDYYDQYYDSLIQIRGAENMQGTGYKDYLRWKWFYSTRHGVDGELHEIWQSISDFYDNIQVPQGYVDNSDWQFMGPLGVPLSHGGVSSENTGKGMMISLWVDDGDHLLIYAGSHHGGLWKTTDGGESWYPLHDNDPRIHGVNSIAVDPTDPNIIYITCNSSLSSDPVGKFSEYTTGLFQSINGGSTWIELYPGINYPAPNKSASARKIIVDPNDPDKLFFISYRLVSRSFDKGGTWDTVFFKNYDPWNKPGSIQFHNGLWDFQVTPWDTSIAILAGSEIFLISNPYAGFDTTLNISDSVFLQGLNPGDSMIHHPDRCEISMCENFQNRIWYTYTANYFINGTTKSRLRIVKQDLVTNKYTLVLDTNNLNFYLGLGAGKLQADVSPSDSNIIYIGGVEIRKVDAIQIPPSLIGISDNISRYPDSCWIHVDMRDMQLFSDGQGNDTLYLANDAGISWGTPFKGDNGACSDNSWYWRHPFESYENGLNVTEYYGISAFNSEIDLVAGGCQDLSNMILMHKNWFNFGDGDGSEIVWDSEDSSRFYFSEWQNGNLYRTNDFGASESEFFDLANGNPFMPMEIDPDATDILYSGDKKLYKFVGINNVGSLDDTVLLHEFPYFISDIEIIHPAGMQKQYYISTYHTKNSATDSNCIYKSTNGSYFTDISAGLEGCLHGFIADVEVNPENNSQIWVAISVYNNNPDQKKKVYKSTDYGTTWQEYAQGLPPGMPVFELRYIPEYQFLLAATDVGIYKRNLQDTCWFPFSNNLPAGKIVTDLEVNVKNNKIYASTYGRGLWKSPMKCEFNETPWTIGENMEWDKDTILDRSIVIDENITVTLSHCKIFMPADAKIVVKRGAELILDDCTLTSACNDLWWGIEVWGNSNYSQSSSIQGRVEIKNNSIIEKARKAIFCGKNIENTYPDWAFTGGIVDASLSTFKNNRYGVQLWTYRHPQVMARFEACKFQTNQLLADGSAPEYFITLVQVSGVEIKGCSFEYDIDGVPDFRDHGRGIYAIDAGFEVMPDTNYTESTFKDLDCGIFALKLYENRPLEVHESYFLDNLTGIYASAIEGLQIYSNEIDLNFDSIPASSQIFGGIYLDNCTGYRIEENTFGETNLFSRFSPSIGITVNNSGEAYNEIYLNTFGKLFIGTLAQNVNRNTKFSQDGLKLNCNVYFQNEYDIVVTGTPGCDECGISKFQGSPSNPAGNLFSKTGLHPTSDFDNPMDSVIYYHHRPELSGTNPWIPYYKSDSVYTRSTGNVWDSSYCSSRSSLFFDRDLLEEMNSYATIQSDSLTNLFQQLIDGGSTGALESEITFAQPEEALELWEELLGYSPYLSDTVLIRSAQKEDVLSSLMVRDIMIANPQSAKSEKVINALENREYPLPDYMMETILQGRDTIDPREILEIDLAFWKAQQALARNWLISFYYRDSLSAKMDSIINLLESTSGPEAKYRLMMAYLNHEDTISAGNTLEGIPQQFDLNDWQYAIHEHWTNFSDILLEMKRDSLLFQDLDSLQLAKLATLSETEELPGAMARNILHYLGLTDTGPYYILPNDPLKSVSSKNETSANSISPTSTWVKIYPNPALNYLIIEGDWDEHASDGCLAIYSSEGKLRFTKALQGTSHAFVINTSDWQEGIYFYQLILEHSKSQHGKIIVLR